MPRERDKSGMQFTRLSDSKYTASGLPGLDGEILYFFRLGWISLP